MRYSSVYVVTYSVQVNQKLDSFLEERRAVKVARLEGQEEELRLQATNRLSAEIEDVRSYE